MKLLMIFTNKKLRLKSYIYINITCLFLSLYVIFYPFFSKILGFISPRLLECTYKALTGKYCPLCGGTRYISNIGQVFTDVTYIFNIFGIIFLFALFEFIFRVIIIIRVNKIKNINSIIKFDIIWHSILAFFLFLYEIIFLITQ